MPTAKDIKFFKGVIVERIFLKFVLDGLDFAKTEVEDLIKHEAELDIKSCKDYTHEEFQYLKFVGIELAHKIGIEIE